MPASVPTARRLTQSEAPLLHAKAGETSPAVASLLTDFSTEMELNQSAGALDQGQAAQLPTQRAARLTGQQNPKVIGQKGIFPAPITAAAGRGRQGPPAGGFIKDLGRGRAAGTTKRCQARCARPSVLPCPRRRPAPEAARARPCARHHETGVCSPEHPARLAATRLVACAAARGRRRPPSAVDFRVWLPGVEARLRL